MLALLSLLLLPSVLASNVTLSRRFSNSRFSNYFAGADTGACGQFHSDDEFVVAISTDNYNGGQYCGKQIYITYQGMSAVASIVDECMGCPPWGLDFSQSLFGHFVGGEQNNNNVGIIYGDWDFGTGPSNGGGGDNGDSGKKTTTTTTHKTTTTTSSTHSPTTTSTTTTTHSSSTTSSSARPSSSSAAAASSTSSAASAGASAAAAASSVAAGPDNLYNFSDSFVNLLGLVAQAPAAQ